jgi:hypothetical protein
LVTTVLARARSGPPDSSRPLSRACQLPQILQVQQNTSREHAVRLHTKHAHGSLLVPQASGIWPASGALLPNSTSAARPLGPEGGVEQSGLKAAPASGPHRQAGRTGKRAAPASGPHRQAGRTGFDSSLAGPDAPWGCGPSRGPPSSSGEGLSFTAGPSHASPRLSVLAQNRVFASLVKLTLVKFQFEYVCTWDSIETAVKARNLLTHQHKSVSKKFNGYWSEKSALQIAIIECWE